LLFFLSVECCLENRERNSLPRICFCANVEMLDIPRDTSGDSR
jgi:hypothetical protein